MDFSNLMNLTPDKDVLEKIKNYNDEMTISQVVRFFERQGKTLTKTMIQNYVRVDVLPPPLERRYYTKKHLLFLYIIDYLKNVYSLEEIKQVFAPVVNDTSTFDDDALDMFLVYRCYHKFYENCVADFIASQPELSEDIKGVIEKTSPDSPQKKELENFLVNLSLMAQTAATKNIVTELIKGQ